jgi:hypothetical protein
MRVSQNGYWPGSRTQDGGGVEGALLAVKGRRGDQPHVTVMLMVEVVKIKVKGMVEMVDIDMQW